MRTIRIGSGAGYSGDRIEPAIELAEKGDIQYLVFECLGERTVALAQQARMKNPDGGYDPLLEERMRVVLPICAGKGKLSSYVINPRPAAPGFTPPYAIAVVELDEGPRMRSNIIDCPQTPEALELDMKLEVAFEKLDDKITLPLFRPAKG